VTFLGAMLATLVFAVLVSLHAHAGQDEGENQYTDYSKETPSATLEFDVTSVKFIGGVGWGSGTLHFQDKSYPLKVKIGSAGGIGYREMKGTGKVYKLTSLEDFPGIYGGGGAGITVADKGAGTGTIENGKGVVISITVTDSSGVQLALSAGGMEIAFADE